MSFKDYFSEGSQHYARHRPVYPPELYTWLASLCRKHRAAWDCGTGNGQAAIGLAEHFNQVHATDASAEQLRHARKHPKVEYTVALAEQSGLPDESVDLVTIALALHWFNFDKFYEEVRRVATDGAIIAAWGYGFPKVSEEVDELIRSTVLKPLDRYWEEGNKIVIDRYETVPFPFEEVEPPDFIIELDWTLEELFNYMGTWSAARRLVGDIGKKHLSELITNEIKTAWGNTDARHRVEMEVHMRVGKIS